MLDRLKDAGFEVLFTSHAEAIVLHDFPDLVGEIEGALLNICLPMTEIIGGGGGEAKMTQRLRRGLAAMHWTKHNFELKKTVDGVAKESISHEIDHVRLPTPEFSRLKSNGTTRIRSSIATLTTSNAFTPKAQSAWAAS